MGPLTGIKVLDLSRILAGPWATQALADFGAEVWKIEQPKSGDDTRRWGPPYLKDKNGNATAESAYFLAANRGKDSLTIDIAKPEGQKLIHQLILNADIIVENFKVGGLKKYQLDYEFVRKIKPNIIYCSITGFGQTGPAAKRPGYDAMIQGMGGLMSLTGIENGSPGEGPQKTGVAVADLMTGMYAISAILAALHHRNGTNEGQHIDLSLLDTQVGWLANQGMNYLVGNQLPERQGTAHPNIVPYQSFETADGYIILAVGNDAQFARCCEVLKQPELANNILFKTNNLRVANRKKLIPLLSDTFMTQKMDYWLEKLTDANVPCGPINTLDRVFDEPQIKHRNMVFELDHPKAGTVTQIANPVRFSKSKIEYNKAPPTLGQDTKKILSRELGIDEAHLKYLEERGII